MTYLDGIEHDWIKGRSWDRTTSPTLFMSLISRMGPTPETALAKFMLLPSAAAMPDDLRQSLAVMFPAVMAITLPARDVDVDERKPFDPAKHPRDDEGKFEHKPDAPEPAKTSYFVDTNVIVMLREQAEAKWKACPPPTEEEVAQMAALVATKGAEAAERNLRGNTAQRHASQKRLAKEFGDGDTVPCLHCRKVLPWSKITRDRIYPGSAGGRYRHPNLIPACATCNTKRGPLSFETVVERWKLEQAPMRAGEWFSVPLSSASLPADGTLVEATEALEVDSVLEPEIVRGPLTLTWVPSLLYWQTTVGDIVVDSATIEVVREPLRESALETYLANADVLNEALRGEFDPDREFNRFLTFGGLLRDLDLVLDEAEPLTEPMLVYRIAPARLARAMAKGNFTDNGFVVVTTSLDEAKRMTARSGRIVSIWLPAGSRPLAVGNNEWILPRDARFGPPAERPEWMGPNELLLTYQSGYEAAPRPEPEPELEAVEEPADPAPDRIQEITEELAAVRSMVSEMIAAVGSLARSVSERPVVVNVEPPPERPERPIVVNVEAPRQRTKVTEYVMDEKGRIIGKREREEDGEDQ
jgi:hypothetical protein